jgi:hypothetical protein
MEIEKAVNSDARPIHRATPRRGVGLYGSKPDASVVLSLRVQGELRDALVSYKRALEAECGVQLTRNDVLRHLLEEQLLQKGLLADPIQTPGVQSINTLLALRNRVRELEAQKRSK